MKIIRFLPAQRKLLLHARELFRIAACCLMALELSFTPILSAAPAGDSAATRTAPVNAGDPILKVMQGELTRASSSLSKTDPAPYFLSYTVNDQNIVVLVGAYGSLLTDAALQRRQADVVMRVGSPALDNTHGQSRASGMTSGALPLGDDSHAISRVLWELTDREYKRAAPAFLNVKTNTAVRAEEEDKSPDFSKEAPQTHTGEALVPIGFDRAGLEGEVRRLPEPSANIPASISPASSCKCKIPIRVWCRPKAPRSPRQAPAPASSWKRKPAPMTAWN